MPRETERKRRGARHFIEVERRDFKTLAECYAEAARRGLAAYEAAVAEPPQPPPPPWWESPKGKKDR